MHFNFEISLLVIGKFAVPEMTFQGYSRSLETALCDTKRSTC